MENRDKIVVLLAGGRIVHRSEAEKDKEQRQETLLSNAELAALLPDDLKDLTSFQEWSSQPISNCSLRMCSDIMHMAAGYVNDEGARGVVVTCDVQGMSELAYFADLVWGFNPPLVFTGSIFHANTPNSETSLRLGQAVRAALSGFCAGKGALICMGDAVYAPADVISISNSRSAGVLAFPETPLGIFLQPSGRLLPLRAPRARQAKSIDTVPARNIAIVSASLGDGDLILKAILDKRIEELDGLVISAFGDGDVPSSWPPLLRKILREGVPVVLATRCPMGYVQPMDNFEGSAAQLLEMGLFSARGLTPLQARIRLAIGLGDGLKDDELRRYMDWQGEK